MPALCTLRSSKTAGRTVCPNAYEEYLQAVRRRQESAEFQEIYRLRSTVERLISELVRHGLRATRYLGEKKRQLWRLCAAAARNLRPLFHLAQAEGVDLAAVLAGPKPLQRSIAPA